MGDFYENAARELKIIQHSTENNCHIVTHLCTENCIMFTVPENHLQEMKKFCEEQFGSCEVVEQIDSTVMCKVV